MSKSAFIRVIFGTSVIVTGHTFGIKHKEASQKKELCQIYCPAEIQMLLSV